jgi:glucose/arabinose dehydrogenase
MNLRLAIAFLSLLSACRYLPRASQDEGQSPSCQQVEGDGGPEGTVPVRAEVVASGLEVPWSLAFLPGGDVLISERPGRVRLLHGGKLAPSRS